ncbi:peroxiredoxin [Arthrobacter sp. 2MCAF14]|uniref:peroxiredoxin n=1 Tax=Arthrobacter sp. 2MCAF14 TaxID=3232982 RepID=UPI003F93C2CF
MTEMHQLIGRRLPQIGLPSTIGGSIGLGADDSVRRVLFVYPRTGDPLRPDSPAWAAIPGAKGCTAEACSFRDLRDDFAVLGREVIGCSVQGTAYQSEAASRLHLPYPIVSDQDFALRGTLGLSTFEFEGDELYRRITLLVDGGIVVAVIEPGQDPGSQVEDVLKVVRQIGSGA